MILYANLEHNNQLFCTVSSDDGLSWSEAVLLDTLEDNENISWISYCQPSTSYVDNCGRFFYAYYDSRSGDDSFNQIKFIRFKVH